MNIRLYAVKLDRPLSEAERSTLARFLPPERQDRIKTSEPLCACALLCRALHELYGLEDLPQLSYGEHGKPYFPAHPDVSFSLSHSGGCVLVGVHDRPLGVDIERLRPVRAERLRRVLGAETELDFWQRWTEYESRCKRRGISAAEQRDLLLPPVPGERVASLAVFPNCAACVCTDPGQDAVKLNYLTVEMLK